jgi:hypothetical protein
MAGLLRDVVGWCGAVVGCPLRAGLHPEAARAAGQRLVGELAA